MWAYKEKLCVCNWLGLSKMMTGMDVGAMCTRRVTSTVSGLAGITFYLSVCSFIYLFYFNPFILLTSHVAGWRGFCCTFFTHRDHFLISCLSFGQELDSLFFRISMKFSSSFSGSMNVSIFIFAVIPPGEVCVVTFQLLCCLLWRINQMQSANTTVKCFSRSFQGVTRRIDVPVILKSIGLN